MSRRFLIFIVIVVLLVSTVWLTVNKWYYSHIREEMRLRIRDVTMPYAQAFDSAIEERFALLEGLHGFAKTLPEKEIKNYFVSYAHELYVMKKGVRNLSIAPMGIQKFVYPNENNQAVTGHNLLHDPREEVREDIRKAIESREIVISGPYELRQGGEGIIARKAVHKDDEFWGLVTMVIDMPYIYEVSDLQKASTLHLAIKDSEDRVVWGEEKTFRKNPIIASILISNETWSIAAIPQEGWEKAYGDEYIIFSITSLLIGFFMIISIVLFAQRFSSVSERARLDRERYENIFNSIRDVVVVTDTDRRIVDINQSALKRIFGYDRSALIGKSTEVLYESPNEYEVVGNELLDSENEKVMEISFKRKDGKVLPAELNAMSLYDKNNTIVGYVGILRDIRERKENEKTIRENNRSKELISELAAMYLSQQDYEQIINRAVEQLHSLFPHYRAAYSTIDTEGNFSVKYSVQPENMPNITGLQADLNSAEEYLYSLQSNRITRITNVEEDPKTKPLQSAMQQGNTSAVLDVAIPLRDEIRGLLCFDSPTPRDWTEHEIHILEEYANLLTLIMDNDTYRKRIEKSNRRLQDTVKEKETLLTEVHHRVKNNLNVIVSLLKLQENEIDSVEKAIEAFEASQKRIYSMALVHESLYKSDKLSEIELDQYIRTLAGQLQYSIEGYKNIEYQYDLDPVSVDIIQAVPCGIVVNELITNAQKHGFDGLDSGKIFITLMKKDEETIALSVEDNGKGLPKDFSMETSNSLGLNLVNILTRQIDGELTVESSGGTSFTITFPAA
ncbi:MAG: PAS domain S-box protein [Spirochaetia bacterium]|nr:PAS domain S-box protein [Spirochaetia bacterium]